MLSRLKPRFKHNIDLLFIVILFGVFTLSAISVLLMQINCYKAVIASSEENARTRIASSYVREIVHQNDTKDSIEIVDFEGVDALKIKEVEDYYIYIYFYDGYMRELNTKAQSGAGLDDGSKIVELKDMAYEKAGTVVKITFTGVDDKIQNVVISTKAKGGPVDARTE